MKSTLRLAASGEIACLWSLEWRRAYATRPEVVAHPLAVAFGVTPSVAGGLAAVRHAAMGQRTRCGRAAAHQQIASSVEYRRANSRAARCGDCLITDRRQQEAVP